MCHLPLLQIRFWKRIDAEILATWRLNYSMIAITEGIPVRDMAEVKARLATSNTRLIGP